MILDVKTILQYFCLTTGVILNILLLSMLIFVPNRMGGFKNLLMILCIFELFFALLSLAILPECVTVNDYQIVLFSRRAWLLETGYSAQIIGLYCALTEIWMMYIALLFLFRYIVLCRSSWYDAISQRLWLKCCIFGLYLAHLTHTIHCGVYLCTRNMMTKESEKEFVYKYLDGKYYRNMAMGFTMKDSNGIFSTYGFFSILNHLMIILFTGVSVIFCGKKIAQEIKENANRNDLILRKQIFRTLLVQAATPIIFYQIPILLAVAYVFSEKLSDLSPLYTYIVVFFAVPKMADPLGLLIVIKEYRTLIITFIKGIVRTPEPFLQRQSQVIDSTTMREVIVYDNQLVLFTRKTWLLDTGYCAQVIGLYCTLYEIWMVYIALLFVYRYITLCRVSWYEAISGRVWLKVFLACLYLVHTTHSIHCGVYLCTSTKLTEESEKLFVTTYLEGKYYSNSAMILTFKDSGQRFTVSGFISVMNHIMIALFSAVSIIFCGQRLAAKLRKHTGGKDASRQKQIFRTLLVQAAIPLLFYQIPTVILVLSVISTKFSFLSPFYTYVAVMFSVPKIADPLGTLMTIKEYRKLIIGLFRS